MRRLFVTFCLGAIGASAALAQNPTSAEPIAAPSPIPVTCVQPAVTLPTELAEASGCLYAETDLLLRWFKPVCASVPIVSVGNPLAPVPGAAGQPGTRIVVGGLPPHKFEFPMTPGMRVTVGWGRGPGAIGLEVSGFLMEQASNSQHFQADPSGFPNSYLPYQAPDNSYQALPFTIPGVVTGGSVAVGSTRLWGIESDLTMPFRIAPAFYGRFLVGGRYLDLTDRVRVANALQLVADPSAFAVGADQFSTRNQFAGPQIGATLGATWGRWSLEYTTKLATGFTHQVRNIDGSPLLAASVASPLLVPGPLLALPSNISHETANRITLVPEVGLKSRLKLNSWCALTAGYWLLYWNKVLCPGDQMSPLVNVTQLPFHGPVAGTLVPKPQFAHTDYFAQGMDFGIQFRY